MSEYALVVQPVARALLFVPPTGQVWRSYYYANGQRIAMRVEGAPSNNGVFYLLSDHLGSTSVTADANGNQVSVLRYYPYGQTRYSSGVTPTTYRYTGQRSDESSTGLYFYGARYYDAYLNRWIQPDSIVPEPGNPQALNRYSYSLSNPLKYTDPSGHWPDWFDYGLGAAYQFVNDQLWGAPNLVLGTSWQDDQSYAFQSGQEAGRDISIGVSVALAVDGTIKTSAAIAAMIPTGGAGAACALATGGACAPLAGGALALEATAAGVGTAEAGYGVITLAVANQNPLQGPKYSARNFRANLKNRTSIPKGMKNPEAHHMLPQAFEKFFKKLKVNIHDPMWGAWVEGTQPGTHQNWTAAYNNEWEQWLTNNPNATIKDITTQAQTMAQNYGISWP